MKVMLDEMERHYGKRPIIYTTVDFYEAILSGGALSDYPIWVRSTKHHPAVKYGSRAWAFWQYQSDGQTPGINGNVDRDVFYGTKEQWDAFLREQPARPAAAERGAGSHPPTDVTLHIALARSRSPNRPRPPSRTTRNPPPPNSAAPSSSEARGKLAFPGVLVLSGSDAASVPGSKVTGGAHAFGRRG